MTRLPLLVAFAAGCAFGIATRPERIGTSAMRTAFAAELDTSPGCRIFVAEHQRVREVGWVRQQSALAARALEAERQLGLAQAGAAECWARVGQ